LLALALILEGRSRTEAAQMNGMDRQTLRDWVHRHNADGVSGLKSRVAVGPLPLLDEAQMTELRELVVSGRTRRSQGRTERIAGIRMGADRLTSADGARHAP
ncbi:MAG TPA: helix-turn-helix domain-containing protein, partial [Acetobacteraceae bacterium]|nr:helix-turn-helix domain-containing protein [Acetobacteraceae bacterium]